MHNFISIKSLKVELRRDIAMGGKKNYEIAACQMFYLQWANCFITLWKCSLFIRASHSTRGPGSLGFIRTQFWREQWFRAYCWQALTLVPELRWCLRAHVVRGSLSGCYLLELCSCLFGAAPVGPNVVSHCSMSGTGQWWNPRCISGNPHRAQLFSLCVCEVWLWCCCWVLLTLVERGRWELWLSEIVPFIPIQQKFMRMKPSDFCNSHVASALI